jgi:hypothetical protein
MLMKIIGAAISPFNRCRHAKPVTFGGVRCAVYPSLRKAIRKSNTSAVIAASVPVRNAIVTVYEHSQRAIKLSNAAAAKSRLRIIERLAPNRSIAACSGVLWDKNTPAVLPDVKMPARNVPFRLRVTQFRKERIDSCAAHRL